MKKFILYVIAATVLLGGLASCNDSDPVYGIASDSVFITVDNYGSYTFNISFGLINAVTRTAQITHDAMPITVNLNKEYSMNIVNAYERGYSLSSLNGTYSYKFVSEDEQVIQHQFTLDLKTEPGNFREGEEYTDFAYNNSGDGHTLSFTYDDIENAEFYGFYFDPDPTKWYPSTKDFVLKEFSASGDKASITLPASYFGTVSELRVYPVIGTAKDKIYVLRLGKYKILNLKDSTLKDEEGGNLE